MGTMYVVRRRTRDEVGFDEIPEPQHEAAFDTRDQAERYARELYRGAWLVNGPPWWRNPFAEGLAAVTTMPEGVFRDWLMDEGIEPPAPRPRGTCPLRAARQKPNTSG